MRPIRPREHAAVGELLATTYVGEGWADEDYAQHLRDVDRRTSTATVLVAVLDGHLVGSVTVATAGGEYAELAGEGEAVIRMLVTDPAARGAGAGTALVEACLAQARAAGCTVVRLSTQEKMAAAGRIYERLGFVRTPERDWRPLPDLLLLTYALSLEPLPFCGHCGEPGVHHDTPLDPPHYCSHCRRRLVVQVHPSGWTARCVEHGLTSS